MSEPRYEFGVVRRLAPDAVGVPGQRRFRLLVESESGTACLWLGKEQLQALGLAIDQLLAPLAVLWQSGQEEKEDPGVGGSFSQPFDVEVEVGRLALGYDEAAQQFLLLIYESDAETEGPAAFSCLTSREQLRALSQAITNLAKAGRPRCPLCGQPMEPTGHVCPGTNGHSIHP